MVASFGALALAGCILLWFDGFFPVSTNASARALDGKAWYSTPSFPRLPAAGNMLRSDDPFPVSPRAKLLSLVGIAKCFGSPFHRLVAWALIIAPFLPIPSVPPLERGTSPLSRVMHQFYLPVQRFRVALHISTRFAKYAPFALIVSRHCQLPVGALLFVIGLVVGASGVIVVDSILAHSASLSLTGLGLSSFASLFSNCVIVTVRVVVHVFVCSCGLLHCAICVLALSCAERCPSSAHRHSCFVPSLHFGRVWSWWWRH